MGKLWDKITRNGAHKEDPKEEKELAPEPRSSIMTGNFRPDDALKTNVLDRMEQFSKLRPVPTGVAMDDADGADSYGKGAFTRGQPNLSDELSMWYASQSFIGHQLCALMGQHWLIMKACAQPARDAVRNGFVITTPTGEIDKETMLKLERGNKRFGLKRNMLEFLTFGRLFGVRIAIFDIEYDEPDKAYAAPFNLDGVKPGSYKGITQVDPYWCAPQLDGEAAMNPASRHFYEPTWWVINGRKYHRSHLIIYRHGHLPDVLKPAYQYGGIPLPQLIMERVYGSERTANEAPLLALTKRTVVYKTDLAKAMGNWQVFSSKMADLSKYWTNNGTRVIDNEEEHEQFDTGLADLDSVIMTQYQIVAAAAEVPSTKLMGTAPKGFNATGEFDESSYHESLESIQEHDLTPFAERHLKLLAKSMQIDVSILEAAWNPLDTPTEKEMAETNVLKSQTGANLTAAGVIDASVERRRLLRDKNSGYAGVIADEEQDGDESV